MQVKEKSRKFAAAEPFIFLFSAVYFAHSSTIPQLLLQTVCYDKYTKDICRHLQSSNETFYEESTHQKAGEWTMFFVLSVSGMSLVTCLIAIFVLQRPNFRVLLSVPGCTMLIQSMLYILACMYTKYTIPLMFVGYCVPMLHADLQGALSLAYLYTASITEQDRSRSIRMAYIESANSLGMALGVLISGFLLNYIGFRSVYICTAAINFTNIIYSTFLLNSLEEEDDNADKQTVTTKESFIEILKVYRQMDLDRIVDLSISLAVLFFTLLAVMGELTIIVLFLKHTPLALSTLSIQGFLCLLFLSRSIGSALIGHVASRFFSPSDFQLTVLGLLSLIFFYIIVGSAPNQTILYASVIVSLAGPLAMSTTRSICTKTLNADRLVLSLASIALVGIFALLIAAFTASLVYSFTASIFPGIAIYTLGLSCIIALIIAVAQKLCKCDKIESRKSRNEEQVSLLQNRKESTLTE